MSPGLVMIDELVLRSPNIRLTSSGTVAFNGKLQLDSQLAINENFGVNFSKRFATIFIRSATLVIQPSSFRSAALLSAPAQTW